VSACYAALNHGSTLTNWIMRPAIAEALSNLKTASGSNQSLLQFVDDAIVVTGLPVLVSDQVDADTLFRGVPKALVVFVQRKGATVETNPNGLRVVLWAVFPLWRSFAEVGSWCRQQLCCRTPLARFLRSLAPVSAAWMRDLLVALEYGDTSTDDGSENLLWQ
jgi:hypothetical protein